MKNLYAFGSADRWGRFLYQNKPSYSPGDVAYEENGEKKIRESGKVEIDEGKGIIRDSECKKEVKTPWDTESQNKLLNALAQEIQKGGNFEAVIAKSGDTLGQIAFAVRKVEKAKAEADQNSFAKIGWGTEVQYLNADMTPAGEPMPLAKANALKPEWKVLFKEVDGKTRIEVVMDTGTTKAQLDALKDAVTKNIECDKNGKPVEKSAEGDPKPTEKPGEGDPKPTEKPGEGDPKPTEKPGEGEPKPTEKPEENKDNSVEKRKENEQKLLNEVVKALNLSKKEIHWKWLEHRIGNYYRAPKQLFHPAEDGISVVVSDRTLFGSNNGRTKEVVLTGDKLKELGISQAEALDILNNDLQEEEYRRGVAVLRYARKDAERKGEELPETFDVTAQGDVEKPTEEKPLSPREQRRQKREARKAKTTTPPTQKKDEFENI